MSSVYPSWDLLSSWVIYIPLGHYLFKRALSTFLLWGFLLRLCWSAWRVPHGSEERFVFLHPFSFLSIRLEKTISIDPTSGLLVLLSAHSDLLL